MIRAEMQVYKNKSLVEILKGGSKQNFNMKTVPQSWGTESKCTTSFTFKSTWGTEDRVLLQVLGLSVGTYNDKG